jgi:hypothetical protein
MRVKVIKGHGTGGGAFVDAGDVLELPEAEAERKIAMGYVIAAPEPAAPVSDESGDSEGESDESDKTSGKGRRAKR